MRCHNDGVGPDAVIRGKDVAYRVRRRLETQLREVLRKLARTLRLLKRRRWYFAQADLIGLNLMFVFGNETKSLLDARIPDNGFDSRAHYLTSKVTGSDSIGGCVARLAVTLYVPGMTTFRSL